MTTLTELLNDPEEHYPGNFDTPERANALLTGLCQDASAEINRLVSFNQQLLDEVARLTKLAKQPAQKRPQNCGTGYCSCIECVMEPAPEIAIADAYRAGVDSGIAAEREACAKLCEELAETEWADNERCAAAIRARESA